MTTLLAIGLILSLALHLRVDRWPKFKVEVRHDGIWWMKRHDAYNASGRRLIRFPFAS